MKKIIKIIHTRKFMIAFENSCSFVVIAIIIVNSIYILLLIQKNHLVFDSISISFSVISRLVLSEFMQVCAFVLH